jgi:hypothetical protein
LKYKLCYIETAGYTGKVYALIKPVIFSRTVPSAVHYKTGSAVNVDTAHVLHAPNPAKYLIQPVFAAELKYKKAAFKTALF